MAAAPLLPFAWKRGVWVHAACNCNLPTVRRHEQPRERRLGKRSNHRDRYCSRSCLQLTDETFSDAERHRASHSQAQEHQLGQQWESLSQASAPQHSNGADWTRYSTWTPREAGKRSQPLARGRPLADTGPPCGSGAQRYGAVAWHSASQRQSPGEGCSSQTSKPRRLSTQSPQQPETYGVRHHKPWTPAAWQMAP